MSYRRQYLSRLASICADIFNPLCNPLPLQFDAVNVGKQQCRPIYITGEGKKLESISYQVNIGAVLLILIDIDQYWYFKLKKLYEARTYEMNHHHQCPNTQTFFIVGHLQKNNEFKWPLGNTLNFETKYRSYCNSIDLIPIPALVLILLIFGSISPPHKKKYSQS